jgi:hypothetical protein
MNGKILVAVGTVASVCVGASAQVATSATAAQPGTPQVAPAGSVIYDNQYTGLSGFGNAAQLFEPTFSGYDIWLGDDFSAAANFDQIEISSVGFVQDAAGPGDPFLVEFLEGRIYDAIPNDANANLIMTSDQVNDFNGIDTWTANFNEQCLPAGDYFFVFAARNDFVANKQTFYFQETQQAGNDGFQWNPNGAFGFPGNLQFITTDDGVTPSAPNVLIVGAETEECGPVGCFADCDGNGALNILDFVCYQGLFQSGDPNADCDDNGSLNILDFVCFQGAFQDGCP